MTTNEIIKEITSQYLIDKSKRLDQIMNYFRSNHINLYNYIFDYTKQLDKKYGFSHRLYWTINNITEFPICSNCGNPNKRIIKIKDGYSGPKKYCCQSCITSSMEYQNKYSKTNLEKYGVENVFSSIHFQKKIKETNLEKYGVENPSQNKSIKQKQLKTLMDNYGVTIPLKSKTIQQKCIQTNLDRYGTQFTFQSNDIKEKIKKTNLEKYGVKNPSQVEQFKQKREDTLLQKFGVDNALKSNIIQEKVKTTNLERYNVDTVLRLDSVRKIGLDKQRTLLYKRLKNNKYIEILDSLETFLNSETKEFHWKCKRCGLEFTSKPTKNRKVESSIYARCPSCFPLLNFQSVAEQSIYNYIQDNFPNLQIESANRTILGNGKEVDIYIPEKNLAIEFDGLYWHSLSNLQDKNYHLNKTTLAENNSIQLIHIFEDEFVNNKDIVLSRIKHLIGGKDNIIYGRKCIIKEVDNNTCKEFLNNTHIQGNVNSLYRYGLYYNNELVSIMTFGHLRKSLGSKNIDNNTYELLRYSSKLNTTVIGGASKLFKYFIKTHNPSKIISYCDRRWSIGKLYKNLGFTLDHISSPNYWYIINGTHREHRFNWRKNVLKDKLKIFDPNLTEYENMFNNGYDCIYDCGNYVFKWESK
jgi:hypothetical protein